MRRTLMRLKYVSLAGLLVLAACGDTGDAPGNTAPTDTKPVVTTVAPTSEVAIAAVFERVEYYGACGNETVTVGGVTYYPVLNEQYPGNNEGFPVPDLDRYPLVGTLLGMFGSFAAAPRVAPPGPGDDIGDMIVYVDGIARFESDSGWVIWLTDQEQTYGWVC